MKFNASRLLAVILCAGFSLSAPALSAQKEAEIVNKLRIALRDVALEVPEPPVVGKGTFKMGEFGFPGTLYYHKPHSRMEMVIQGATFIAFSNDTLTWEYNPFEKTHAIQKRDPEARDRELRIAKALDIASRPLLDYKKLKNKLVFKGEQKIDSIQAYVLELTLKDPDVPLITFYISKRTNLIYKCQAGELIRWYANYKPVGPYVYPAFASAVGDRGMTMTQNFDEITIGQPIADSLFRIPKEAFESQDQYDKMLDRLLDEADSLLETDNDDAAIAKFTEVLKLDNSNYDAYNGRGLAKTYKGKYYQAIADFNIALEHKPKGSRAFNNRGLAKFYLGDKSGALEDYNQALKLDTAFFFTYKNRGLLHFQSGQYEEAKADFSKAMVLRPTDGDSHYKYGVSIAQLGRYEEALASYAKAISLNHATDELYNYRGVAEFKLTNYRDAVVSFREAIKKNETNMRYHENLGNALYYSQQYKEAESVLERYLEKEPTNAYMYNLLALCKYNQEDFKGAIKLFTKAIEVNDKDAVYFANRADAKSELEDYDGSISDYTQSIVLNPNDASVFYRRGLVKIHSSKKLEGCADLGTAHDMKYEGAKDAILKYCN